MNKIKVLEVLYGFGYGGIRTFITNSLEYIDKSKFHIDIYAFGTDTSPFTEKVKSLGANIYFQPENNVRNIIKFVNQLEIFMKEHGPYDVVHAHCNLNSAWVLLAAKRAGVPIRLSHSHSTSHFDGGIIPKAYSYLRRYIIGLLATTKLACGKLAGETMYGKNVDYTIVNNGIDLDRFMYTNLQEIEELRKQLDIPTKVRVYANVTRMDPPKNHIFAIEVFNEIHKIDPTAILIYGGTVPSIQPTLESVKSKIEEYGLNEFVRFTGPIMSVEHLYHMSDAWIYCSSHEGLPFGPIELQASGVPCLASDVITKDIDLGLGLIDFISLNEAPKKWAIKAVSMKKISIDKEKIRFVFKKYNFDIKESVKKLEEIYSMK